MSIGEFAAELLVGVLVLILGYLTGWKGKVNLIHSYQRKNVTPEDKQPFARKVGIGTIILGLGLTLMPVLNWMIGHNIGYYTCIAALLISCIVTGQAVIQYNGSLFGNKKSDK